jgi:hypothetical protein
MYIKVQQYCTKNKIYHYEKYKKVIRNEDNVQNHSKVTVVFGYR